MAAVAMRLVRLTYLARHQPQRPARQELTEYEVEALLDLDVESHLEPATLTVWEALSANMNETDRPGKFKVAVGENGIGEE